MAVSRISFVRFECDAKTVVVAETPVGDPSWRAGLLPDGGRYLYPWDQPENDDWRRWRSVSGTPYAPHDEETVGRMLDEIGVDSIDELFDVPDSVAVDGEFGIETRSERAVRREIESTLARTDDVVEFLGRGHYGGYVPSVVDHLADRSEFLTSYTQYQPEIAQGFLQALFEYQSLLVELTGLGVANCSMYDAAAALGEAATLAARVTDGRRVLVPETTLDARLAVLANYVDGPDLTVETYAADDGTADLDDLAARAGDDTALIVAETPTVRGTIEPNLAAIGEIAADADALYCVDSDPVALSVLQEPAAVGADVVVGDASVLGLGTAYGTGLGLFAVDETYVRQVPGRLVGATEDAAGRRGYTLTLQTREQHIRQERATSNICTNQAWVALRAAMHAAWLGPDGLVERANEAVGVAETFADRIDGVAGVVAPVHDRRHMREFVAHVDRPAGAVVDDLAERGFAVHALGGHEIGICPAATTEAERDRFVTALREVEP
ncbi:aminomethyl-transferring glycine dehydrogenase [Halobacteriales archaeon SW_7_68_16]|nr:MAG: aminomethyl-transferring glycine dehydrogenase [Halobacteriales archaeon SW_7_68_16]